MSVSEKRVKKALFFFDADLWKEFNDIREPFGTQQQLIENIIKIFVGDKTADQAVVDTLRKRLETYV